MEIRRESSDPRVILFFRLIKELEDDYFQIFFQKCLTNTQIPKQEMMIDLLLMCFQTRNCRGGKGIRNLFRRFFLAIYHVIPEDSLKFIPLILHYGYGGDLISLCDITMNKPEDKLLFDSIVDFCVQKLKHEYQEVEEEQQAKNNLSLLAKWVPSNEKKKLTKIFAYKLFPRDKNPLKAYRFLRVTLRKRLDLVEVKMCANQWEKIVPETVPFKCRTIHIKALTNIKIKEKTQTSLPSHYKTGNRYPKDPKRVSCRQNHLKYLADSTVEDSPEQKSDKKKDETSRGEVSKKQSPLKVMKSILCDPKYDPVRAIIEELGKSGGIFEGYKYLPSSSKTNISEIKTGELT